MMRNRVDMEGNIMAAIIGSPTRYIQGKGEMKNLCSYADKFGKNLFILTSASGRKRVEPAINEIKTAILFMMCSMENAV